MPTGTDAQIIGKTFGRLTVISEIKSTATTSRKWLCKCSCGGIAKTNAWSLASGRTQSCGCLLKEKIREAHRHGLARRGKKSYLYLIWCSMRQRCKNPKNKGYMNYGGRGIKICARWNKYENFLKDIGDRPTPKHTLDRMNNNGNYEPSNCKWSTRKHQTINRRYTKLTEEHVIEIRSKLPGHRGMAAHLARKYGVTESHISSIKLGKTWK